MTYYDLLERTEQKKQKVLREFARASKGNAGWLVVAEIKKNPGRVAYLWLAQEFCETLADHIGEWVDEFGMDSVEAREISDIYQTWYNDEPGLYDLLPTEARLWDI